jgi:predicted aminopeptidase
MNLNIADMQKYLNKWQAILRLQDWDIKMQTVDQDWRKSGDIKIDIYDKTAILLINIFNPKQTNLEELIIHELLHLKLYGMDQTLEKYLNAIYGEESGDSKRDIAYGDFMALLESTVNDLAKSFLIQSGDDKEISFGRLQTEVNKELEK